MASKRVDQESPYDIDTFCGMSAQDQKDEIARLADHLEEIPGPDNNGTTRRATYEQLRGIYNAREAGAVSPELPPSPSPSPPPSPQQMDLDSVLLTPDEYNDIPDGRAGRQARENAWATLLAASGSSAPRRKTSVDYRRIYETIQRNESSNNNRNRQPKRSRDPRDSEQQNQEQLSLIHI